MASTRFRAIRKKLDQLGFKQPLSMESTCLVEKLLNEIEKLKTCRSPVKSKPEPRNIGNRLDAFACQIKQLTQENNQLHQTLMKQTETSDMLTQELRNKIRKLEHENCDLRFLNSQYMYKVRELEKENHCKNERILQLQEKEAQVVVQTRGQGCKKRDYAFHRQKMEISNSLPQSCAVETPTYVHVDDPYVANMLEVADKRISQLRRELCESQTAFEELKCSYSNLQNQLEIRDAEIDRLNRQLTQNDAINTCLDEMMTKTCNDNELERLRNKVEKLENENSDLQIQLCNAQREKGSTENCVKQLTNRNKTLEQEIHQIKNMTDRIQEDKEKLLRTSAMEIGQSAENGVLKCDKEKLEEIIRAREQEICCLENEKTILNDKLSQLTSTRLQLESEVSQLKQTLNTSLDCRCKCKCGKKPYFTRFEENLAEIQRNYGSCEPLRRSDFMRFASDINPQQPVTREHKTTNIKCRHKTNLTSPKSSPPAVAFGRRAITPPPRLHAGRPKCVRFIRSPSPDRERLHQHPCKKQAILKSDKCLRDSQSTSQIKALVEERDYYQRCYESLRNRGEGGVSPPTRDTKMESALAGNIKELTKERDELKKRLIKTEEQNTEYRNLLQELQCEKDHIQKQCRETEKDRRKLEQELSIGKSMAERSVNRRLERENEIVNQDLQSVLLERDTLREKLKLATDTHIQERRRLEKQIGCLQSNLIEKEQDLADSCSQSNAYRTQVTQLEDQIHCRDHELAEKNDEVVEQKYTIAELKKNLEKLQNCLDETEHKLRVREASGIEKYAKDIEEELVKLRLMHREYLNEMDSLRHTITCLDGEKDQLQMEVDVRTEKLASLEDKLKRSERNANDLKITCNTLEVNLDRQRDEIGCRDKEIRTLRRELEIAEKEIQQLTYCQNNLATQGSTLQDDIATMTRENQRLHADLDGCTAEKQELKYQIQSYIAEVTRFEELLREKDQERMDLLSQFQNITLEANSLESQNNQLESETATIRVELHAKNVEVQHLQTVLGGLQQEIEQYITVQQSMELEISQMKRTITSLDEEYERCKQERDNILDDMQTVRSLCSQIEMEKEKVCDLLAKKETECERMKQELEDIQNQLDCVQGDAQQERIKTIELETLLSNNRRKEFESQLSYKDTATELRLAQEQLNDCDQRLIQSNRETLKLRSAMAEMTVEVERLQRQLTNEKFERELACQELRKLQAVYTKDRLKCDDTLGAKCESLDTYSSYEIEGLDRLRSGLEAAAAATSKPEITPVTESVRRSDPKKRETVPTSTRKNTYSWRQSLSWDKSHRSGEKPPQDEKLNSTPPETARPKMTNFRLSQNDKGDEENYSLTRATTEVTRRFQMTSEVPTVTSTLASDSFPK